MTIRLILAMARRGARCSLSTAISVLGIACAAAAPEGKHFMRHEGALTPPASDAPRTVAESFIRDTAPLYGLTASDLSSIYLVKEYKTDHNGVTHLVFRQRYAGLDVSHSDFVVNIARDGSILNAGGRMYTAPEERASPPQPASLSPAIRAAMRWADPAAGEYTPIEVQSTAKLRRFARTDGRGDIEGRALWYPVAGRLQPAWEFYLNDASGARQRVTFHSRTHYLLHSRSLTEYQEPPPPRGLVFTRQSPQPNPQPGVPMTEPPPYVERVLVSFAGDPQASPAGWIEGTETAGNNVIAGKNPLAVRFLVEPVKANSPPRDFQFPLELGPGAPGPTNFIDAAVTNLFYWMNRAHDMFWHIGFNEAAGNYQKLNFGRGGIEGDPIYAYAQFGIQQTSQNRLNNAFYTARGYEDGSPAMIAMFIGFGANGVFSDGSYDTEVMIHEYTHGVSRRLVRDLDGFHGGAMSEAWSDFFALEFTVPEGAPVDGVYPSGDYLFQRFNVGIRTRPYSTDMSVNPATFADMGRIASSPAIHQDATIWVSALWDMRANLIRQFGEREGRRRTRLLVIDGMKLSVPTPTMVEARDAILLADRVNFRGESQAQIWAAFAKRGLGATAFARNVSAARVLASFTPASNTGALSFAQERYALDEPIRIVLNDPNLAGDIAVVQVTSGDAGDLETVRLRREGSIYTGELFTTTFGTAVRENSQLSVLPGSIISAYYGDERSMEGRFELVQTHVGTELGYWWSTSRPQPFTFADERPLNLRADSLSGAFARFDLPWEFPFFGRNYSSLQIHPNGLLTFAAPEIPFFCSTTEALGDIIAIAPMFMNIRTSGTAQPNENVFVGRPSEDAVSFRWAGETEVDFVPGVSPEPVNFAVTLYRDGRIEFRYGTGNKNLANPSVFASAFGCPVPTPVVGISNGTGEVVSTLIGFYSGRSTLENAAPIVFEPPTNAQSAPRIRIEVPNETDTYVGVLTGRGFVWDPSHPIRSVHVVLDGVSRGNAPFSQPPQGCIAERLPNCIGITASASFEAAGITPGPHKLKVIATNTRGGINEQEITFNVGEGQSRVPIARIETPVDGAELSGNITVRGWAAAENLRVTRVDVLIDGVGYGAAQYGVLRREVCDALGFTSPNCPNVGFQFTVNSVTGGIPLPNGEHRLELRITDETGRITSYPETPVVIHVNNAANQPPTGILSTPRHNDRVSGTVLIYGSAWDPDGRITSVQLLVDGVARATLPYGDLRTFECESLPDVPACPNIGFWFDWNTRTVLNGPHVLGIRVVDNGGRARIVPQNAADGLTVIVDNQ